MKPRLESRQFTNQDVEAMCHVSRLLMLRHGPGAATRWLIATAEADRRDADLMYQAVLLCQSIERYVRPSMAQDAGCAYRVHRALYLRFLAHGERPRFRMSDVT